MLASEIETKGENRIRALIVVGGNPILSMPDPVRTTAAFDRLELLVTLEHRSTETSQRSHYQIATSLPYERYDNSGILEFFFCSTFAQASAPILKRPEGVIDDWEFFHGLARRLNKSMRLKRPLFGVRQENIPGAVLEISPDSQLTTKSILEWMTSQGSTSLDQLLDNPHGVVVKETPQIIESAAESDEARLDVCPPDVATEIVELFTETWDHTPHSFRLISRRMLEVMNSAFSNAITTRERFPVNPAFMNGEDMKRIGVADGDRVEISSEAGSVVATALKDKGLAPGTVSMAHMWGTADVARDPDGKFGAFTGCLVSSLKEIQTINCMPRQSALPVDIRALRQ